MNFGIVWCMVGLVYGSAAEKWRWPEGAASVRIDTKVRFIDDEHKGDRHSVDTSVQADEVPFREPTDTEGFYNRPPGVGRYPVRSQAYKTAYYGNGQGIHSVNRNSDGTLDSLQYCKCLSQPDCVPRPDSQAACGAGKYLCCYRQGNHVAHNSEFFNEVDDERPVLLPNQETFARPFPPPPGPQHSSYFGTFHPDQNREIANIGPYDHNPQAILVGPNGPTGSIGLQNKPNILVGPEGPTGIIGPNKPNVLVGPDGPTGIIGPVANKNDVRQSETAQRGVLVGPGGPTGIIGPGGRRGVLVGPGGPTGIIGPGRPRNPGVLVGPGGPTGIIGPAYNRYGRTGILTGPGGPTGTIGPGRPILVGPGGPTGQIGPQSYFR